MDPRDVINKNVTKQSLKKGEASDRIVAAFRSELKQQGGSPHIQHDDVYFMNLLLKDPKNIEARAEAAKIIAQRKRRMQLPFSAKELYDARRIKERMRGKQFKNPY